MISDSDEDAKTDYFSRGWGSMRKILATGFTCVVLMVCSSFAQGFKIVANIPHEFVVESKTYAPGNYEFSLSANPANQIQLLNLDNKSDKGFIPILTRISQTKGEDSRIVFDKAGEKSYLAEIHIAGMDGFHLKGAPGPHTHIMTKAK